MSDLAHLFREHSRLTGLLAGNVETWLADPGTLARYLELVPAPREGETTLVDIGCYQPSVGYYFRQGWRQVEGIFKEPGEATIEGSYRTESGAEARFARVDVEFEGLPVRDASADLVLMMEVLEHFAVDPMHALWECNRVLKEGGRLVVSTPNATSTQLLLRILRGRAPLTGFEFTGYTTNRHNRLYDATELVQALQHAGFAVDEVFSRTYSGQGNTNLGGKIFSGCTRLLDAIVAAASPTGRRRERGHFLCARATKRSAPLQRFPVGLYFDPEQWPGMAAEREKRFHS